MSYDVDGRLPAALVPPLDGDRTGADYRDQVHAEDIDSLEALVDMADDARAHGILRVRSDAGAWRLVEHRPAGRRRDGTVKLERRDVTGRELALERAGKTETYWRTILRHGHESIAVLDPDDLTIRHASDHLGDVLGRSPESLVGSAAVWHVDPRDLGLVREVISSFHEDAESIHRLEVRLRRQDAPPIWMEATVSDARTDTDVAALVVNLREIGDRKWAEERLRSSEHLFRVLVQHVADGAVVVDRNRQISFVSPRAAVVLGSAESDLVGRPLPLRDASDGLRIGGTPALPGHRAPLELLPGEARNGAGRWFDVMVHDLTDDPVVAGWVLVLRDITDRRDRVESLRRQVESDSLTGLTNRRGFERRVERSLADGHTIGIGFLDLNGFKAINDRLGHAAGDSLLIQVGRRLSSAVRPNDEVARFGGDEFVVALIDMPNHQQLIALTSRIADHVGGEYRIEGAVVDVSVSAGWSLATPGTRVADALQRADRRMYLHKRDAR